MNDGSARTHDRTGGDVGAGGAPGGLPAPPRLRDFTKLPIVMIAAMFAAGIVLWPHLPASIPTHWGISGRADAFAPRGFMSVFFEPTLALGIYALLVVVPFVDPKRRDLMKSIGAYNIVIDLVVGLQALVFAVSMIAAFRPGFDVVRIILLAIGVMFAVIGNYMTTVRQNWTFGVRVSWTLADEVVWRRTNRLGGYLFVIAGVVTAACAFVPPPWNFIVMLSVMLGIVVVVYAYAYLLYRSRHPEA